MYRWNMQFHPDNSIKGDFDVKARGTASLVAREVRAQQLDNFSQMVANPMDAPFIKRDKLLRQRAEAHELSDVIKTEDEVASEQNNGAIQQQQQLQQKQMELTMAELQQKVALLTAQVAKATASKVEAVYSALQAGGVATSSPHIAPAGDEILRSSGWKDATPDPSIAQLGGPPVQTDQQAVPGNTNPMLPAQATAPQVGPVAAPDLQAPGAAVGMNAGIETPSIE
jgi:hypothetical protein